MREEIDNNLGEIPKLLLSQKNIDTLITKIITKIRMMDGVSLRDRADFEKELGDYLQWLFTSKF